MRGSEHLWLAEQISEDPSFLCRPMFGCQACYLNGLLVLVFADDKQPWNGMLVATSKEHHAWLQAKFSGLVSHPVLGKWLYLSAEHERFEVLAREIVKLIARGTERIGVTPRPKLKSSKKSKRRSRT